jgi:hypothetical protein
MDSRFRGNDYRSLRGATPNDTTTLLSPGCNSERILFFRNEAGMSLKTKVGGMSHVVGGE